MNVACQSTGILSNMPLLPGQREKYAGINACRQDDATCAGECLAAMRQSQLLGCFVMPFQELLFCLE